MSDYVSDLVERVPQLRRGQVWCLQCGRTQRVDSASALWFGWPKCCGYTMTIDSPDERVAMKGKVTTLFHANFSPNARRLRAHSLGGS
jgi:hypothetical protein